MSMAFYCDCKRYCNGERRQVSKTTFYFYKKTQESQRNPLSRFSGPMQAFLNENPVVVSTPPSKTTSQKYRKQGIDVTNTTSTSDLSHSG